LRVQSQGARQPIRAAELRAGDCTAEEIKLKLMRATRKTSLLLVAGLVFAACMNMPEPREPKLEAEPLDGQIGRWHQVTSDTVRLTVSAPGAERIRLLYKPFAAVGRHAELKKFTAEKGQSEFAYEWKAGSDLAGDVWAEITYPDGMRKQTEPLAIAHQSAIGGQAGEVPLDSVGGSVNSDESARADKFTGGRIEQAALKAGDRHIWITVNVPAFRLTLWQNGKEVKIYEIGIGRKNFPLPVGARKASEIIWNPEWIPPDSAWVEESAGVEPGERVEADDPRNPLGKVKIRLGDAVLIHEAAKPSDIGRLVSHGCVRMLTADIYDLTEKIVAARSLPVTKEQIEQTRTNTERLAVKIEPPLWEDINYATAVIEGRTLHLYPDVYGRGDNTLASLRAELREAGVPEERLDDQTLRQMNERVSRTEEFVVSVDDIKAGRALTAGRTAPLTSNLFNKTSSAAKLQPERPVILHQSDRICRIRNLSQAITIVSGRFHQSEQFAPGILRFPQLVDVRAEQPGFQQREALLDRATRHIFLIRVPADADLLVACGLHHLRHSIGLARIATVDFDPDLDVCAFGEIAAFAQG
jgi:hypothetical protein